MLKPQATTQSTCVQHHQRYNMTDKITDAEIKTLGDVRTRAELTKMSTQRVKAYLKANKSWWYSMGDPTTDEYRKLVQREVNRRDAQISS